MASGAAGLTARSAAFWRARAPMLTVAAACMALGIMVVLSQPEAKVTGDRSLDVAAQTIERLEAEQALLREEVTVLQNQVSAYQRFAAARSQSLTDVSAELEQLRLVNGLSAVRGPGVRIVLSDSTRVPASGEGIANYLVQDFHLRDLLAVVYGAGAEAVAINGERVVNGTAIFALGGTILVNGTRVAPPYEVRVIGDPDALYDLLEDRGTLFQLREAVRRYGLGLQIERSSELELPGYNGAFNFRYGRIGTAEP